MLTPDDEQYLAAMRWRRNAETAFLLLAAVISAASGWFAGATLLGALVAVIPLAAAAWKWYDLRVTGGVEAVQMRSRRRAERQVRRLVRNLRFSYWTLRIAIVPLGLLMIIWAAVGGDLVGVAAGVLVVTAVLLLTTLRETPGEHGIRGPAKLSAPADAPSTEERSQRQTEREAD